jgi:hypothetical protein
VWVISPAYIQLTVESRTQSMQEVMLSQTVVIRDKCTYDIHVNMELAAASSRLTVCNVSSRHGCKLVRRSGMTKTPLSSQQTADKHAKRNLSKKFSRQAQLLVALKAEMAHMPEAGGLVALKAEMAHMPETGKQEHMRKNEEAECAVAATSEAKGGICQGKRRGAEALHLGSEDRRMGCTKTHQRPFRQRRLRRHAPQHSKCPIQVPT